MHRACWGGDQRHTDTVRVFLEAGVSPFEKTAEGKDPVDIIIRNPGTEKLLREWMAKAGSDQEL